MVEIDGITFLVEFQSNIATLVYPTILQEEEPSDEVSLDDTTSLDDSHNESYSSEDDTTVQEKNQKFRFGLLKKIKKFKNKKSKKTDNKRKKSKLGSLLSSATKMSASSEPSKSLISKWKVSSIEKQYLQDLEESSGSLFAGRFGSLEGELEELPTISETAELQEPTPTKTQTELVEERGTKSKKRWKRLKRFLSIQKKYMKQQHDDTGSTSASCNDTASTSTNSPTRTMMKSSDLNAASDALCRDDSTMALASTTNGALSSSFASYQETLPCLTLARSPLSATARQANALPNPVAFEDPSLDHGNIVVSPVPSPPGSPSKKIFQYKKKIGKKAKPLKEEETQVGALEEAAIVVSSPFQKKGNKWALLLLVGAVLGTLYVWQTSCWLPQESKQAITSLVNDNRSVDTFYFPEENLEMDANLVWSHDQSWSEISLDESIFDTNDDLDISYPTLYC